METIPACCIEINVSFAQYKTLMWFQFYGTMCVIYILYGFIWFVLCARNWRDLLRIQLWIGAIIVLGMVSFTSFLLLCHILYMCVCVRAGRRAGGRACVYEEEEEIIFI